MAQKTIDLSCIADSYVSVDNPTTNYGSATVLYSGGYGGKYGGSQKYYAVFKFNFASLPARKKIISMRPRVYSLSNTPASDMCSFDWGDISDTWAESTVNYNTFGGQNSFFSDLKNGRVLANTWVDFTHNLSQPPSSSSIFIFYSNTPGGIMSADYWQIASRESGNPPVMRVVYEDVPPDAPIIREPVSVYKDSSNIIRFNWQYNSSVGGVQKKFDLLWSTNGTTWTTVSQTTANTYYDMPANTFLTGNVYWKVKTYNEYDEASPESNVVSFYAIGAPAAPNIISINTNTSRPTITWGSPTQQVYQLQILKSDNIIYDTGNIASISAKTHKVTDFLNNGDYKVKLRIKNEYGLWSAWTEKDFTIAATKPNAPTISLQRIKFGVALYITSVANAAYYVIYKAKCGTNDYSIIGKTTALIYNDFTGENKQEYQYFVRAVTATETYNDSNVVIGSAEFDNGVLCPISDMENIIELRLSLNEYPVKSYQSNTQASEVFYSGRRYPVMEISEFTKTALTLSFAFSTYTELETFIALYAKNEVVLYRDNKGWKLYGMLSNLSVIEHRNAYAISITITQVDYQERLEI